MSMDTAFDVVVSTFPSSLTLLCQILSSIPRAGSQVARLLLTSPASKPQQKLRADWAMPPWILAHTPLASPVGMGASEQPGPLTISILCPFPPKDTAYLRVEEFLSSRAGKTTAAFACLENNLQFTKHSAVFYLMGMLGATL